MQDGVLNTKHEVRDHSSSTKQDGILSTNQKAHDIPITINIVNDLNRVVRLDVDGIPIAVSQEVDSLHCTALFIFSRKPGHEAGEGW